MTDQTSALSPVLGGYFLQATDTFFMTFDKDVISYANNAAIRTLNIKETDLIGKNDFSFIIPEEREAFKNRLDTITGRSEYFILHILSSKGTTIELKSRLLPVILNNKKTIMLEGTDESLLFALKKKNELLEEKLAHISPIDLDTRLPSIILLDDRIEQAILRAQREAKGNLEKIQSFVMVMAVRIDGLSQVEGQFGSDGKRFILDALISRFKSSIRSVDTLAKDINGYFYFLFEGIREKNNLDLITSRLKNCIALPILYKDNSIKFSVNFGVSFYPDDGASAVGLIKAAKVNLTMNLKN